MARLLVNNPQGKQEIIEVGEGGGYFDHSRVLWDDRQDGPMPDNIILGAMVSSMVNAVMTLPNGTFVPTQVRQLAVDHELKAQADANAIADAINASLAEFRASRAAGYPPITDFADAYVKLQLGNPAPMVAYVAACEAVKISIPKPAGL